MFHLFEHNHTLYAFDPVSMHCAPVEPDEASFLTCHLDCSSLGWEPSRIEKVKEGLSWKGLLSSECCEEIPPSSRVEVLVNASQTCNLACTYCFVDQGKFGYSGERVLMLSPHHARRLVEVLPEGLPWVREFSIHFYGGEPLLNVEAIRAAVEATKKQERVNEKGERVHFTFSITTNGTVLTEEAISILKQGRFSVVLSIDGPDHIHDSMRCTQKNEPTHARVMEFLQRLRKQPRLQVRGSAVVRRGWSLHQAEEYLRSLDVDVIKAQAVRLSPEHPLMLSGRERGEYMSHLAEIADDVIDAIHQGKMPRDDRFNTKVLQMLRRARRTSFCGAGMWNFGVASDGTILPCVLVAGREGMVLGHLDDPPETWVEEGKAWAERNGPRPECQECWALPLCGGGCPAMLGICGEDECELTRANCELALAVYGAFYHNLEDLLVLAGIL